MMNSAEALTSWKWDLEEVREGISEGMDSSQLSALQRSLMEYKTD